MKNMKRFSALFLAATMALSVAACGSSESASTASQGSSEATTQASGSEAAASTESGSSDADTGLYPELTVAVNSDWKNLEPAGPNQDGKANFIYNIYESLFDMDDTGKMVGNLATDYEIAEDKMSVTANLYDCIYDSDGNHITADDVVYTVNWLVDSGNALGYDNFDHIEKTGDYQVTFYTNEPITGNRSLEQFFLRTLIVSEKAASDHNLSVDPCGTGNYIVTSVTTGSGLTMEANENYWAKDLADERQGYHVARVQKVNLQIISEAAQAAIALEMGTVDCCAYIDEDMLYEFEEGGQYSANYSVVDALSSDFFLINPNRSEESVCKDVNLMKAIYYALDNESIAKAMGGTYRALSGLGFSYFGDWDDAWAEDENYINTYDLEKSAEYLAQSDYNGEEIEMIGLNTEAAKNGMTMIQMQLAQAGINVKINAYDQDTLGATMASQSGWDMQFNMAGGTSFIGTFGAFKDTINDGYNKFWFSDAKLTELKATAESSDATPDDIKAFNDYVMEMGYQYSVAALSSSIVVPKAMTQIYQREGYFTPAACYFE